jgi:hypothetical protein
MAGRAVSNWQAAEDLVSAGGSETKILSIEDGLPGCRDVLEPS